jgi:UDP-N-acetylglucosamine 2-epimerase (non-hydrolysing)
VLAAVGGIPGRRNVERLEPVDYRRLVLLLRQCRLVLTDSGGIQEEAPTFGKPVLVLREKTERPEAVEAGRAVLVGTDEERIVAEATRLLADETARRRMSRAGTRTATGAPQSASPARFSDASKSPSRRPLRRPPGRR